MVRWFRYKLDNNIYIYIYYLKCMPAVKREKGMYSWSRCQWSASVIRIDESVIFFLDIIKILMYVCIALKSLDLRVLIYNIMNCGTSPRQKRGAVQV